VYSVSDDSDDNDDNDDTADAHDGTLYLYGACQLQYMYIQLSSFCNRINTAIGTPYPFSSMMMMVMIVMWTIKMTELTTMTDMTNNDDKY
jgi:hypothetical protein